MQGTEPDKPYSDGLLGIMKDNAQSVTSSGAQTADAVPQIDAINPTRPLHRTVVHGKGHGVTLVKRDDLRARLHARPLLRHNELPTGKISYRL